MIRRAFLSGAGAAGLGACAPSRDLSERWPPLGPLLDVDGLRVHAWDRGEGPLVVLIHGASGNLRDWTFSLAPRLARTHRVIAFDRPGHGYSARLPERGWEPARQAAHLRNALARLADAPPIVVGHSWGASLAMAWALDAPETTAGVVTLGGATMPWGGALESFYNLLASEITGPIVSNVVSVFATEARARQAVAGIFAPQTPPEDYLGHVGFRLATRPRTLRNNARDLVNLDAMLARQSRHYPQLGLPVEVLHGTADTTVAASIHSQPMVDLLPRGRLTMLDGVGHMPHHADEDAVLAAISRLSGVAAL